MRTNLEKHHVCVICWSVNITDTNCICAHSSNYPTVELEFEVCGCCGSIISDGQPEDTEFNKSQLKKLRQ